LKIITNRSRFAVLPSTIAARSLCARLMQYNIIGVYFDMQMIISAVKVNIVQKPQYRPVRIPLGIESCKRIWFKYSWICILFRFFKVDTVPQFISCDIFAESYISVLHLTYSYFLDASSEFVRQNIILHLNPWISSYFLYLIDPFFSMYFLFLLPTVIQHLYLCYYILD